MTVFISAITSGELHAVVSQIATATHSGFGAQTARVTLMAAEMEATKAQIETILQDCRTFASETKGQADAQKAEMILHVVALLTKMQDIIKFVDSVPDTVASLKDRLEGVTSWLSANHLESLPDNLRLLQMNPHRARGQHGPPAPRTLR